MKTIQYQIPLQSVQLSHTIQLLDIQISDDLSTLEGITYAHEQLKSLEQAYVKTSGSAIPKLHDIYVDNNQTYQGILFIKNHKFHILTPQDVLSDKVEDRYRNDESLSGIMFNDEYYYTYGEIDTDGDETVVQKWLIDIPYILDKDGNYDQENIYTTFEVDTTNKCVYVSYGVPIYDSNVVLDGTDYFVDTNYHTGGVDCGLRLSEESEVAKLSDLNIANISLNLFPSSKRCIVTPFTIEAETKSEYDFDYVTFGKHALLLNYHGIITSCHNLSNSSSNPQWGISNVTNNTNAIVSAACYTFEIVDEKKIDEGISGTSFADWDVESLYKYSKFYYVYLAGDMTKTQYPLYFDLREANDGRFLLMHTNNQAQLSLGTSCYFESTNEAHKINVIYDAADEGASDKGAGYVIYKGQKYDVITNLCDQIKYKASNDLFTLIDVNYLNITQIGKDGAQVYATINDETWTLYYSESEDLFRSKEKTTINNGTSEYITFEIDHHDGVEINGERYRVNVIDIESELAEITDEDGNTEKKYVGGYYDAYIEITEGNTYDFKVGGYYGSNIMLLYPDIYRDTSRSYGEQLQLEVDVCRSVVANQDSLAFYYKSNPFADKERKFGVGYVEGLPSSSANYYNLRNTISIYGPSEYIPLKVPLMTKTGDNPLKDVLQLENFHDLYSNDVINDTIDMEKEIYSPMRPKKNGDKFEYSDTGFPIMLPIYEINFNLHFRTRDLDNWKAFHTIMEPEKANWFITDYEPYASLLEKSGDTIINLSDLMGLLDFNNDDIHYQKQKVKKSFLRLSVYDSPDIQTQTLLHTATVWLDSSANYKKMMINSKRFDDIQFQNVYLPIISDIGDPNDNTGKMINPAISNITALSEPGIWDEPTSSFTPTLNEEHRLSSHISIANKYDSSKSSEGFYMYIYKEYAKGLQPVPLYMKIEFNHAGIGQTLPFYVPMHWTTENDGTVYPDRTLSIQTTEDLEELKKGSTMEDMPMESYIPLYCAYDKNNHQYFYYFDERYVASTNGEGSITLNLFEMKGAAPDVPAKNIKHAFNLAKTSELNKLTKNN